MAPNEPQTSGSGETKFGGGEPVKQEAEVKVHPSAVVETTTTTTKTMDVDGQPTQVQETVKTKPREEKPDAKKPEENKPDGDGAQPKKDKDKAKDKDKEEPSNKEGADGGEKKKKRHWLLERMDEKMIDFEKGRKPHDWMVGFKFGYETVAGIFILADKLLGIFGPKPAEAGITAKQGTVAGLNGKEGGTFKMLENAGLSGNKPAPGQGPSTKPALGTQMKQRVDGMKQGVQTARRNATPGRKV